MAEIDTVIIIPSQGADLNAFLDSAMALNKRVFGGRALIVRSSVSTILPGPASGYAVTFETLKGDDFSFAGRTGLRRVVVISHSYIKDGPNLAYGAGGYQPWGTVDGKGEQLTPYARLFWVGAGEALRKDGAVLLLGCLAGAGEYGRLVADAAGKPVYASGNLFSAGNAEKAVGAVEAIEAGRTPAPFRKFGPLQPVPAAAPR